MNSSISAKKRWTKAIWPWVLGYFGMLALAYFLVQINPLPNDEELITHFETHRADIEALVKSYRDYGGVGGSPWEQSPETRALMHKAGVDRVDQLGALWLPNPYLPETAELIDRTVRSGSESGWSFFRRHGSIGIEIDKNRYFRRSLRYPLDYVIWKTLFFYPEEPRIENGWIVGPARTDGKIELLDRVLPSLNSYPSDWKRGECVARKLDAQWFIIMCRAM